MHAPSPAFDLQHATDAVRVYFTAERDTGWALFAVGMVAVLCALALWRRRGTPFFKGLLAPVLLLALAGSIGGPLLALRSADQLARFPERLRDQPAALHAEEGARMAKVNANWRPLKITWVAFIVVGGIAAWSTRGARRGAAVGTVVLASMLVVLDVTAQARALRYTAMLDTLP